MILKEERDETVRKGEKIQEDGKKRTKGKRRGMTVAGKDTGILREWDVSDGDGGAYQRQH